MSKKKLLHISLGTHNQGMWRAFDNEFETIHYDWTPYKGDPGKINMQIISIFNNFQPDIVFMQLQEAGVVSVSTAQYMSESSITINWTGDVRYPIPEWYVVLGRYIDITLFSNMHDVDIFQKIGINAGFLQVGFDERVFTPIGSKNNYPDIIFLGSNYEQTSKFPLSLLRLQMVQTLRRRYGGRFMAYGFNWRQTGCGEHFLYIPQETEAYRSCKIAINLSHFDYGRYSSDRLLRIMGSGAFCLSHHYKEIEKDYTIGEHLDTWKTIDGLINKIEYYLNNPTERNLIREKGCDYVHKNFTWNNVMIELKKILGDK